MAFDTDLALRVREGLLTVSGAMPDDAALQDWLSHCFAFVRTLPPK